MIVSSTTRNLSAYPTFVESHTSSHIRHGSTSTESDSYNQYVSIEGGTSLTVMGNTAAGTASFATNSITYHAVNAGEFGFTTSANATMYSTASSQSSSSSFTSIQEIGTDHSSSTTSNSDSFSTNDESQDTFSITETVFVPVTTSSTSYHITTTNTTTETSHYTFSGTNFTTSSTTTDLFTSTFESTSYSLDSFTTSETHYGTYTEAGVILSADSDLIWIPFLSLTNPHLVTDFATSVSATTIWAQSVAVPLTYAIADDEDASSSTMSIPDLTTAFTYDLFLYSDSVTTNLTSGNYFSRTTYSTSLYSADTTSETTAYGNDGGTITALSTDLVILSTSAPISYVPKNFYTVGYGNLSTSTQRGIYYAWSTTTSYSILPNNLPLFSTAVTYATDDLATSEAGNTVYGTNVSYSNVSFIPFGEPASALTPIAPYGCFISPDDLKSAGDIYAFGSNLSFQGGRIPYGEVRSVLSNAQVPYPSAFTTTGTNSHTYRYSWSSDTLKVTESSTAVAGTGTTTLTSTSEGTFNTVGGETQYLQQGGSLFGGFQPIESASESVTFFPRAVLGTSIDTNGESTTYRTLVTSFEQSTVQGTLVVETAIPAYRVWTYLGMTADLNQYLVFQRN